MKKIYSFLALTFVALCVFGQGFNSSYAVIAINGGGGTYYRMNGANNWGDGNPNLNGANLGTFMMGDITKLNLKGVEGNVYKNVDQGQDISNVYLHYVVYPTSEPNPGVYNTISVLPGGDVIPTGGTGGWVDQKWEKIDENHLLLNYDGAALEAGDYTLEIYLSANTNDGTIYLNNNGANYKATFTIIDVTTWDGASWDHGAPTNYINAHINGNINTVGAVSTKGLTISTGQTLTIPSGSSVNAHGDVVNNGLIIVRSNGNFVQQSGSNYSGSGSAIVQREAKLKKMDYNYWGSPVSGQNLYDFSEGYNQASPPTNPQGTPWNRFFVYNESNDYFVNTGLSSATAFEPGKGYAIRGKNKYGTTLTTETFSFNGTLNNGPYSVNLQKQGQGYNLVANPYPSNIDANNLLSYNINNIDGTIWYWTNLNEVTNQQGSSYGGNNYAIYTSSGGAPPTYVNGGIGIGTPLRYIKVGQGFLVKAKVNGANLNFTNGMRSTSSQSVFFNKGVSSDEDDENLKDRFWLKLISPQDIVNTILVAYIDGATQGYDDMYDAELLVVGSDSFYSRLEDLKLQIQARGSSFTDSDIVKLGNKHYIAGINTIALDNKNGIFADGQAVYLKDKVLGIITNLQEGDYNFYSEAGEFDNRFEVIYQTESTLNADDLIKDKLFVYKDGADFIVKSESPLKAVELFDMSGRLVFSEKGTKEREMRINGTFMNRGAYVVRVYTEQGVRTKKIIK